MKSALLSCLPAAHLHLPCVEAASCDKEIHPARQRRWTLRNITGSQAPLEMLSSYRRRHPSFCIPLKSRLSSAASVTLTNSPCMHRSVLYPLAHFVAQLIASLYILISIALAKPTRSASLRHWMHLHG